MLQHKLLGFLFLGQGSPQVQMAEAAQTSVTSTHMSTQPTLIGSQLPATAALQNLLSQNLQGQLMNTN
jgi:hypothetical protein